MINGINGAFVIPHHSSKTCMLASVTMTCSLLGYISISIPTQLLIYTCLAVSFRILSISEPYSVIENVGSKIVFGANPLADHDKSDKPESAQKVKQNKSNLEFENINFKVAFYIKIVENLMTIGITTNYTIFTLYTNVSVFLFLCCIFSCFGNARFFRFGMCFPLSSHTALSSKFLVYCQNIFPISIYFTFKLRLKLALYFIVCTCADLINYFSI